MSEELRLDFLDNEPPQLLKSFTETYKSASPKGLEPSTRVDQVQLVLALSMKVREAVATYLAEHQE